MKKAVIFIEPWEKAKSSRTLVFFDRLIRYLELGFILLPLVKLVSNKHSFEVYSQDVEVSKILRNFSIQTNENEEALSIDQINNIKEYSIRFARSWHQCGNTKSLTFYGIDLGLALEQEVVNLVYRFLVQVESLRKTCYEKSPDIIGIENSQSAIGRALTKICDVYEIDCFCIFPEFYGHCKNKLVKKITYQRNKSQFVDQVNLYFIGDKDPQPNAKNILVDAPYLNYLSVTLPVAKILLNRGFNLFFLAREADIENFGINFNKIDFEFKMAVNSKKDLKLKFKKIFSELSSCSCSIDSFNYKDIHIWEALKDNFYYILNEKCVNIVQNLEWFNEVISLITPDIILVGDDRAPSFVRSHILFAQNINIPVVEIQHGIYSSASLMVTPISDKICVWGDFAKEVIVDSGGKPEQIVVTGSPKLDNFCQKVKSKSLKNSSFLEKKILFATQPFYENLNFKVIEEIGKWMKNKKNVSLVIKPHPTEIRERYEEFATQFGDAICVRKGTESIDDLIIECDILISGSSTVVLNAAIACKPIILLSIGENFESPYKKISIEVTKIGQLVPIVENLLDIGVAENFLFTRGQFIYEHTYLQDGKSSERVAELILEIIGTA